MKTLPLILALWVICATHLIAQHRLSVAPTYWFQYNPYKYRVATDFNGQQTDTQVSGYKAISSVGLVIRYQFTTRWDLAIGGLYARPADHVQRPQSPYGAPSAFTSQAVQFPLLVSYRLTNRRLSPYFSAGTFFTKSITFTSPLQTDGVIAAGIDYQLGPVMSLLVQPTASYSFSPPVNDVVYQFSNYQSYNVGIQAQLLCRF